MSTVVATDVRACVNNGRYYFKSQVAVILKRYYESFGKLTICCRLSKVEDMSASLIDVTDMIEDIVLISSLEKVILGFYDEEIKQVIKKSDFVICRCPGMISHRVAEFAKKGGKPYLAESMGCAWDAYWNHGVIGKTVAPYVYFKMKKVVYNADYALYVTSQFLQERYPCKNESISASNVLIETIDKDVLKRRLEKIACFDRNLITLMTTAAVDVRYKGQEFVIKAIPKLNKAGIRVHYILVGGGEQRYLKDVAKNCGVDEQVEFLGRCTLDEVIDFLDLADIYIQPSLTEGLPRSMIEAMSRACPIIGARTAGIPELIEERFVVNRKSSFDIAEKIVAFSKMSSEELSNIAKRNFEESYNYEKDVLDARRNEYFEKIKTELKKR